MGVFMDWISFTAITGLTVFIVLLGASVLYARHTRKQGAEHEENTSVDFPKR